MTSPIRPTDDEARDLARSLMKSARVCALAVLDDGGAPQVSRIALGIDAEAVPVTLISQLSQHTQALSRDPRCSLLVGEIGSKGDPLTHPRLTLQAKAQLITRDAPEFDALKKGWLESHPKSKLYIGFGDFIFAQFTVLRGFLNGGFGKAYQLTAQDLAVQLTP